MWNPTNRTDEWTATVAGLEVLARRRPDYRVTDYGDARYVAHGFWPGTSEHAVTVEAETLDGLIEALNA